MDLEADCLVTPYWWDVPDFIRYYKDGFHTAGAVRVVPPSSRIDPRGVINGTEHGIFEGKTWRLMTSDFIWVQGTKIDPIPFAESDHWHTGFQLNNHQIHIDFISHFRGGPQTSYREYRIFLDGEQVQRGGGKAGFLMAVFVSLKNWPVSFVIDEHLIYINRLLQNWVGSKVGEVTNDPVCSIWTLAEQTLSISDFEHIIPDP